MITIEAFRQLALSLPEATEQPHFDKPSFRVRKKIFATLDLKVLRACVKLSEVDQSVFCGFDPAILHPVPNKWGRQGWTLIDLNRVPAEMLTDALTTAYCEVAPPQLAALVRPRDV
jgi:hypothetical protein